MGYKYTINFLLVFLPMPCNASPILFPGKLASINTFALSEAINMLFPLLPLYNEQNLIPLIPPCLNYSTTLAILAPKVVNLSSMLG